MQLISLLGIVQLSLLFLLLLVLLINFLLDLLVLHSEPQQCAVDVVLLDLTEVVNIGNEADGLVVTQNDIVLGIFQGVFDAVKGVRNVLLDVLKLKGVS